MYTYIHIYTQICMYSVVSPPVDCNVKVGQGAINIYIYIHI